MYMSGFITHITNDNFIFISIELTYFTSFTIWTLPRKSLNKICIQGRLMTNTMKNLFAFTTFNWFLFITWANFLWANNTTIRIYCLNFNFFFSSFNLYVSWWFLIFYFALTLRDLFRIRGHCSSRLLLLGFKFLISLSHWISYVSNYLFIFRAGFDYSRYIILATFGAQ